MPEQKLRTAVWDTLSEFFVLDDLPEDRLGRLRRGNDRDVARLLTVLTGLGAVELTGNTVAFTAAGREALARLRGEPRPGDPVHELRIQLKQEVVLLRLGKRGDQRRPGNAERPAPCACARCGPGPSGSYRTAGRTTAGECSPPAGPSGPA